MPRHYQIPDQTDRIMSVSPPLTGMQPNESDPEDSHHVDVNFCTRAIQGDFGPGISWQSENLQDRFAEASIWDAAHPDASAVNRRPSVLTDVA